MAVVKLLLFAISTLGSFEIIRAVTRDKMNRCFLPSMTIALQVSALFLAGILNVLPEMTYALYIAGFIGLVHAVWKRKGLGFLRDYISVSAVFFILVMAILAAYVNGKIFTGYDNFSHWALVVRRMLETNRYPNFLDTVIFFQEYPLGSSTYIYFFAKLVGKSESIQMLAQAYMIMAAIFPLFTFAKRNSLLPAAVMLVLVNLLFLYIIPVVDLLVDMLLPVMGACGMTFAALYCRERDSSWGLFFSSCYMILMVQIKNSGLFFAALAALLILHFARKNGTYRKSSLAAVAPFLSTLLWHKHCDLVFAGAEKSKHAMTAENFLNGFAEKSKEDIIEIGRSLLRFSVTYKDVWITVGFCVLVGILIWLFRKDLRKLYIRIFVLSAVMYFFYQVGMLAMYVFSMPIGEALTLASVERYTKTILTAILYLNMIPAMLLLSSDDNGKNGCWISAAGIIVGLLGFMVLTLGRISLAVQRPCDSTERSWVEAARETYEVPMYESYCMLIPEGDYGYAYFLLRYMFQTTDVSTRIMDQAEDMESAIGERYIFVYDRDNEVVNAWIIENYPEQYGNDVIVQW